MDTKEKRDFCRVLVRFLKEALTNPDIFSPTPNSAAGLNFKGKGYWLAPVAKMALNQLAKATGGFHASDNWEIVESAEKLLALFDGVDRTGSKKGPRVVGKLG